MVIRTSRSKGGISPPTYCVHKGFSKIVVRFATSRDRAQLTIDLCRKLGVTYITAIQVDLLHPRFGPQVMTQALQDPRTTSTEILVHATATRGPSMADSVKKMTLGGFLRGMQALVYASLSLTTMLLPYLIRRKAESSISQPTLPRRATQIL